MRDPKRIDRILAKVKQLWLTYPDLRLCQLMYNTTKMADSFYLEDDLFEETLDEVLKNGLEGK